MADDESASPRPSKHESDQNNDNNVVGEDSDNEDDNGDNGADADADAGVRSPEAVLVLGAEPDGVGSCRRALLILIRFGGVRAV